LKLKTIKHTLNKGFKNHLTEKVGFGPKWSLKRFSKGLEQDLLYIIKAIGIRGNERKAQCRLAYKIHYIKAETKSPFA
jgi:hypothetical protein